MKKLQKLFVLLLFVLLLGFVSCTSEETKPNDNPIDETPTDEPDEPKVTRFLEDYTPTSFSNVTYTEEEIVDGLIHFTYTLTKIDGNTTVIHSLEVDLNKVNIEAGTANNQTLGFNYSKTTPYAAGAAYKKATGKEVYATLNADFFGSQCVNAFVKDGFIIKASHNDNGNYDYKNTSSDVPASAPMLFGVKGDTAQVAPIIKYSGDVTSNSVKREIIRSKLTYTITAGIKSFDTSDTFKLMNQTLYLTAGDIYAVMDISKGINSAEVLEIKSVDKDTTLEALTGGKAYLYCASSNTEAASFLNRVGVGAKLNFSVKSPDGLWDGYTTILGCRQALVIDGEVPNTVALENTNGAQSGDVPRSAVGVNKYNKVCIYAVESMYYGKKNTTGDPHGCNLPLLAEFMYYNNVVNGANFDGGGSTQLICNVKGTNTVFVRSSDTGSTDLTSTRAVMNVIMVTQK